MSWRHEGYYDGCIKMDALRRTPARKKIPSAPAPPGGLTRLSRRDFLPRWLWVAYVLIGLIVLVALWLDAASAISLF